MEILPNDDAEEIIVLIIAALLIIVSVLWIVTDRYRLLKNKKKK